MTFTLDNQTILYIIIGLFIVQLLIMKYYVQSAIDDGNHRNNKKIIKKMSEQIGMTFDQYMGGNRSNNERNDTRDNDNRKRSGYGKPREDIDSIEDPADDINDIDDDRDDNSDE